MTTLNAKDKIQLEQELAALERERGIVKTDKFVYCQQKPTRRQKLFLELNSAKEVFYGGAAGGGKSSCLLMDALKYVHIPDYSALILRRTYADLSKQGAIMDRAKEWLFSTPAKWNEQKKTWTFPSGARLAFGYLDTENDKYQYQGAEYQFIGFDELTQFTETQYRYLFSRLRRLKNSEVPIRMRSASNPGGVGGKWVNERFIPEGFQPDDAIEEKVWTKNDIDEETGEVIIRYFVPARMDDNPHLDQSEYELSLRELDPVTRAQLRRGDWQIQVKGDILFMWDERYHVITWTQFEKIFGCRHIPLHWQLGVFQDWGTTDAHPCVTSWFATASANSPLAGSVFLYRELTAVQSTAREVKNKIYQSMATQNEIPRCQYWEMSHEASSERLEYQRIDNEVKYSLPFINWKTGKTRGIEQLKGALSIRQKDVFHPFNPTIYGRPLLYVIVDDAEILNPKTDAGVARGRAEAVAYKWNTPKSGEPPTRLEPFALFNDAMDVWRSAAARYFPNVVALTDDEQFEENLEKHKPDLTPESIANAPEEKRSSRYIMREMERKDFEAKKKGQNVESGIGYVAEEDFSWMESL
jgi:hypothetical protein